MYPWDAVGVPRQNRVTPFGELIAVAERGLVYGNRGCLVNARGEVRRGWEVRRWIACRLAFKGRRRRPLMAPGRYTELFFLDEVTALAAGHRPCAECRREDYQRFRSLWAGWYPDERVGADAIDARLHAERLDGRERRLHRAELAALPDGAMVVRGGAAWIVLGPQLLAWTPAGYTDRIARPASGSVELLTPPSLVALLAAGWEPVVPLLHPSAER